MKTSAPSLVAAASSCIVLFCTSPAEAFIPSPSLAASSFASSFKLETLSRNSEPQHLPLSSTCGGETVRSLKRYRPRVPGTLRSSLDDGDVGEAGGTLEAVLSEWKKVAAATAVGLAIFTGGVLVPAGEEGVVGASLAPSLMQDEKGYISIFEKVGCVRVWLVFCVGSLGRLGSLDTCGGVVMRVPRCTISIPAIMVL